MVTLRRKLMIGLLVIDILLLASLLTSNGWLEGWIFFNFLAIVIWLAIKTRRKKKRSEGIRSYDATLLSEKEYGIESVTLKGDTVKSRKEKIIADYLFQNKLRYEYEPPVYTRYGRRHRLIGYADFLLLDYNVYVEYWGLVNVDDPHKREEYNKRMQVKKALYFKNNIKFISLYESNLDSLDWAFRKEFKNAAGFDLQQL